MNGNQNVPEDSKSRAQVFFEKALSDLKKMNYPLAEFYILAAIKEDPENQEYVGKLQELQKILAQEKEAAKQAGAGEVPPADLPPADLPAPAKQRAIKKPDLEVKKIPRIFGIPVKHMNPRIVYVILGVSLGIAVAYSVYATMNKQEAHVNIGDIKNIYGIELKSASLGEGKIQGFVTESWKAMPRAEREAKVQQLFLDFHKNQRVKTLVFWDDNFSVAAEVSESGVNVSP
ncbi:MAG: hypothetical protein PHE84_02130 [bacterium]|nr:hypothetical protein [bacterium]